MRRCRRAGRGARLVVKAYVVVGPGVTADDALATALQEHVKREIAPYKYPRAVEFVAQLPKTETGKLKRFALRRWRRRRPRQAWRRDERPLR